MDVSNRFWDKVDKNFPMETDYDVWRSSCWNWIASLDKGGYGKFKSNKKTYRAHRFAWYLLYGSFPTKWLLHKCNNRKCVNPEHLYEGSPKDNTRDSIESGTFKLVSKPKLTDKQKEEIKNKYQSGIYTQRELGKEYNVVHRTIQKILRSGGEMVDTLD